MSSSETHLTHSADLLTSRFDVECHEHRLFRRFWPCLQAYHCFNVKELIQFQLERKSNSGRGGPSPTFNSSGLGEESEPLARLLQRSDLPEIWAILRVDYDRQRRHYVVSIRMNREFHKCGVAELPQFNLDVKGEVMARAVEFHTGYGRRYREKVITEIFKVRLNCLDDLSDYRMAGLAGFSVHHPISHYLMKDITVLDFDLNFRISWSNRIIVSIPIKVDSSSILHQLFEEEETKDVTILVAGGKAVKCHKLILAANSPVLAAMVSPSNGMVESQTGTITLEANTEKGILLLVQCLYGRELLASGLDSDVAVELFRAAHLYQLTQLEKALGHLILQKSMEWFTADVAVELYFFVRNVEEFAALAEHLIQIMTKMPEDIRSCERFAELNPKEMQDLLWKLFHLK